jgi:hypothetical protein
VRAPDLVRGSDVGTAVQDSPTPSVAAASPQMVSERSVGRGLLAAAHWYLPLLIVLALWLARVASTGGQWWSTTAPGGLTRRAGAG